MASKREIRTTADYRRQSSESAFQEAVIELAQRCGWKVAHFRPVRTVRPDGTTRYLTPVQADGAGFPDLVMVRYDVLIFAELKSASGRLSMAQREWLDALSAAVLPYVWTPDDWDEIERVLR